MVMFALFGVLGVFGTLKRLLRGAPLTPADGQTGRVQIEFTRDQVHAGGVVGGRGRTAWPRGAVLCSRVDLSS